MEAVSIRPIEGSDLAGLLRVYVAAWQEEFGPHMAQPLSVDELQQRAGAAMRGTQGYVAVAHTHPVGYLVYRPVASGELEVLHWYVDPTWQGKGVGRQLVQALRADLQGRSAHWWAWSDNHRASRACRALGAHPSDRRRVDTIGGTRFAYQQWQLSHEMRLPTG